MKRIAFGVLWFLAFCFVASAAGSLAASTFADPAQASIVVQQATFWDEFAERFVAGFQNGNPAVRQFMAHYGASIFFGALLMALGGTAAGILPGTQSKHDIDDEPFE